MPASAPAKRKPISRSYAAEANRREDVGVLVEIGWADSDGKSQCESFTAHPENIGGMTLIEVPNMKVDLNSAAMIRLFREAFGEEEFARFHEFTARTDVRVQAEVIAQIAIDLYEDATGRPTQPSAP